MKKLVINLSVLVALSFNSFGQGNTMYPMAPNFYIHTCTIDNEDINVNCPHNIYLGSSNSNMLGPGSFNVLGNSQVVIKAKAINLKDTHIKSENNNGTHISARSTNIACNYSTTNGFPDVPIYEKIEFGIELPEEIQVQIDLFLNSNTSAANANHPGLNPYDPDDISIEATVTADINDAHFTVPSTIPNNPTIQTFKVYGFYYQEAAASADLTTWTINTHTPYPFRVRIAPPYIGNYKVEFSVIYKTSAGYNTLSLSGFMCDDYTGPTAGLLTVNFNAVANTSGKAIAKGYLEVGQHKRHLRHSYDNSSFFPIGMNLPELPADNPSGVAYGPGGYQKRRNTFFSNMASNHGNYVRLISFSFINSIENINDVDWTPSSWLPSNTVKKLGNYQTSQMHMFETDMDVQKCEDLNLFIHFCLQIHYPFMEYDPYGGGATGPDRWACNAYKIELGLDPSNTTNVKEFFTDARAKRFFKNKLRYAQARWGYSAAISTWQLCSEVDQFGLKGKDLPGNGPWYAKSSLYDQNHLEAIEDWNCEMSGYVKTLSPKHLINTTYIANPFSNNFQTNFGACYDRSFLCPNLDLISYHSYTNGPEPLNRGRFYDVNQVIYDDENFACIGGPMGYYVDKPILLTEIGTNAAHLYTDTIPTQAEINLQDFTDTIDKNVDKCTDIEVHNAMWAALCGGQAGTPLQWHNNSNEQVLNSYFSNYNALHSFVDDLDFETHQYQPCVNEDKDLIDPDGEAGQNISFIPMDLEIFVMANDNSGIGEKSDRGFGWVHHDEASWPSETEGTPFNTCLDPSNSGLYDVDLIMNDSYNYKLNGFKPGDYFIEVYNTKTGALIPNISLIHGSLINILSIDLPHVVLYKINETDKLLDYAFKFWHVSVNGNDLREINNADSTVILSEILKPENDLKKYFFVNYYPNPSSENIQVSSSGEPIHSLTITDLTGKVVLNVNNLIKFTFELSVNSLSKGVYFLNVKSTTGIIKIFKLMKQ